MLHPFVAKAKKKARKQDEAILDLYKSGATMPDIARRYGISRQRVLQRLKRIGYESRRKQEV
jgi:transposase-like protein